MPFHLKSKKASYWLNMGLDALLLLTSFFVIYYTKRGHVYVEQNFLDYLPLYLGAWFLASLLGRKFKSDKAQNLSDHLKPYIRSILLQIGFLSIFLYALKWFDLSRFIIFGSVGLFFLLELVVLSGSFAFPRMFKKEKSAVSNFSFYFFFFEFLLITGAFLGLYFYKRGTLELSDDYRAVFVIIYFVWIFIGILVHKFHVPAGRNYLQTLWPFVKSTLIQMGVISFFVFTFRVLEYSRLILFGSVALFALFEYLVVSLVYIFKKQPVTDEPQLNFFAAPLLREPEVEAAPPESERIYEGKYRIKDAEIESLGLRKKLQTVYLKKFPALFKFIDDTVDLDTVDMMTSEIIKSSTLYNVEVFPDNSLDFFMNLHEVNDFRRVNNYFLTVHQKLKWNGVFVGRFQTFTKRRQQIFKKYPYYLAAIVYLFDFIWTRVFPKLPFFQKVYFAFTKGRDRAFSKAEALGRLYFSGFEVVALEEIDDYIYYVVSKKKEPSAETSPSYGPLFKMRRVGKNGQPIYVYKFRTMHPYSEYLQEYITRRNGYAENGKIKDDFRATAWGKFLRKYWLDELPQLINVFRGEMRLVGIRPLSNRFLKEYPPEIRDLRLKYKPGCVPPYVALKMQDVESYIESERIYLTDKQKAPFTTDIKYFSLAVYNIVTNKIRSA